MVEGENVASDGVLVLSSVCGEQRFYDRDVVRVICNLWRSGVYVSLFKKVFHNILHVMFEILRHCVLRRCIYVGVWWTRQCQ